MADSDSIKLCECGCGQPAPIATKNVRTRGILKGQPYRFVHRHTFRGSRPNRPHAPKAASRIVKTRTYRSWSSMIGRCTNQNAINYARYGGRGISVCDRWRHGDGERTGFECFRADMGERPEDTTLDRYPDNDGNYEPGNTRWATDEQQNNNRRRASSTNGGNRFLTLHGREATLAQWAAITGIKSQTILYRLASGWSVERALTTPSRLDKYRV